MSMVGWMKILLSLLLGSSLKRELLYLSAGDEGGGGEGIQVIFKSADAACEIPQTS